MIAMGPGDHLGALILMIFLIASPVVVVCAINVLPLLVDSKRK